jgi:hypothetical protein
MNTQVFFIMLVLLGLTQAYPQSTGVTLNRRTGEKAIGKKATGKKAKFSLGTLYGGKIGLAEIKKCEEEKKILAAEKKKQANQVQAKKETKERQDTYMEYVNAGSPPPLGLHPMDVDSDSEIPAEADPEADGDNAMEMPIPNPESAPAAAPPPPEAAVAQVKSTPETEAAADAAQLAYVTFTNNLKYNGEFVRSADIDRLIKNAGLNLDKPRVPGERAFGAKAMSSLLPLQEQYRNLFGAMQVANQANVEDYQLDLHGYRRADVVDAIKMWLDSAYLITGPDSPKFEIITGWGKGTPEEEKVNGVPPVKSKLIAYFNREDVKSHYKAEAAVEGGVENTGKFKVTALIDEW